MAISRSMKDRSKKFTNFLDQEEINGKKIEYKCLYDFPDNDVIEMDNWIQEKLKDKIFENSFITLNITGGTKLMPFVVLQRIQKTDMEYNIIYVDTQSGTQEIIDLQDIKNSTQIQIKPVLGIENSLLAIGYKITDNPAKNPKHPEYLSKIKQRVDLTNTLANYCSNNIKLPSSLITFINARLREGFETRSKERQKCEKQKKCGSVCFEEYKDRQNSEIIKIINLITTHQLWKQQSDNCFEVSSKGARKYLTGGWLEEFVYLSLLPLEKEGVELGLNLQISPTTNNSNEIDIFAAHNNQFLLCECKTKEKDSSGEIYKMDSIAAEFGPFAHKWYITALKQEETFKNKAEEKKVTIIGPEQLFNIEKLFREKMMQ